MSEDEEFEFRLRHEQELADAAKSAQPVVAQQPQQKPRLDAIEPPNWLDNQLVKLPNWLMTGNKQIRGVVKGAGDPVIGAAQLLANVSPLKSVANDVNQWVKSDEAKYQQQRGEDGIDWSRGVGNVISPANLAVASKLPVAASLLGRVGQGAGLGALSGLMNPETGDRYGMDKTKSVGVGAIAGGVLPGIVQAAKGTVGTILPNIISAWGTHTGAEPIKQAAKAGYTGGKQLEQFTENMRGNVPAEEVLDIARKNVAEMGRQKAAQYRAGMQDISKDKSILGFDGIDEALGKVKDVTSYKGQVKNEKAAQVQQTIDNEINKWKSLDPAEYHTPEGLDALKQKIGAIVESIPYEEKTALKVGRDLYNSVKNEIINQAPTYAKVMKDYANASNLISEIEKGISIGNRSSADTAMRKLQSVMRNNANTNYGNRTEMVKKLEEAGGNELMPALAGQSLSSWTPRGLGGTLGGAGAVGGYLINPLLGASIAASQSPRFVGEVAKGAGALARYAGMPINAGKEIGKKVGISPVTENMRVAPGLTSVINDQRRR